MTTFEWCRLMDGQDDTLHAWRDWLVEQGHDEFAATARALPAFATTLAVIDAANRAAGLLRQNVLDVNCDGRWWLWRVGPGVMAGQRGWSRTAGFLARAGNSVCRTEDRPWLVCRPARWYFGRRLGADHRAIDGGLYRFEMSREYP